MIQINGTDCVDNVQVIAFTVNPKDYKKLNQSLKKHILKNCPLLKPSKVKFEIGMILLDLGPRINKNIEEGFVLVSEKELYGNIED